MVTRKNDAPAVVDLPSVFDPEAMYNVDVIKSFTFGSHLHTPAHDVVLRGDVAEQFRDCLASATLVKN